MSEGAAERFWIGPARIVEMAPSPETDVRYWEVYCETCRTHECMFGKGDPRLTEQRDAHNRAHAERPLPWPGGPEHTRIHDLDAARAVLDKIRKRVNAWKFESREMRLCGEAIERDLGTLTDGENDE